MRGKLKQIVNMKKSRAFFINQWALFFILVFLSFSSTSAQNDNDSLKFIVGDGSLGRWRNGILSGAAEAPGLSTEALESTLVLAEKRTNRPDILSNFRHYRGGWDITNKHYWASVCYTGAAGFILAVIWFTFFGVALVIHYRGGWIIKMNSKESRWSQRICLIMLIFFTVAAVIGCILLSVGQDEFHSEALHTLYYVVNQSDYTVQILKNVTGFLSLAKTVNVAQVVLSSDVKVDIDKLNVDLNEAARTLWEKTKENSVKIRRVFNAVRSALITTAIVMLVVSVLGLFLSILGHRHAIHIFVISGWLLVAVTLILCGIFVILDNAISDTCMAMEDWVEHPHSETALSNILPCVDQRTTNKTLIKSKQVVNDLAGVVNTFIDTFANSDPPRQDNPNYFNQSGPLMSHLCYPYDSNNLEERQCAPQDVSAENASLVWQNYICTVSDSGLCTTVGRLTPEMYGQLVAAVNVSYGLEHYAPLLLSLQNCDFVRDTFRSITTDYCPPLDHHLQTVNVGLVLISTGVLLSLVIWIMYANRTRREEVLARFCAGIKGCRSNKSCKDDVASKNSSPKPLV